MQIADIILKDYVLDKLIWKHNVTELDVRQVFNNKPRIIRMEKGNVKDEHLYVALGRTDAGRYLLVFFILKKGNKALIVTARDMSEKERRRYAKK